MRKIKLISVLLLFIFGVSSKFTVDIFAQAYDGYTLFAPNNGTTAYLTNMSNTTVHTWTNSRSGNYSYYMNADGSLYRSGNYGSSFNGGGATGVVQKISWSGTLQWEYIYSSTTYRSHHDFCPMPNGNVLLIAWESKTSTQCVQAGLNHSGSLWPDHIVEIQPVGTSGGVIVWQWHFWDHLIQDYDASKSNYGVVGSHPELLDINVGSSSNGDWMHCNSINYNSVRNEIVICSHNLDELYVIDHSTTTAEAASHTGGTRGHGGDFLYRWGRPSNYRISGSPQVFDVVHCAVWIPTGLPGAGDIMAFNNREMQSTSMIVQITPPYDTQGNYLYTSGTAYGPASPTWSYTASGFYSNHLGGCQRLLNGNTIISESTSGYMFEVNSSGTVQWSYNRGGEIVRVLRYPYSYLATGETNSSVPEKFELSQNYPNPFNPYTAIKYNVPKTSLVKITVYNVIGQVVKVLVNEKKSAGNYEVEFSGANLSSGAYFYKMEADDFSEVKKMVLIK
jgi:hypothetical protein